VLHYEGKCENLRVKVTTDVKHTVFLLRLQNISTHNELIIVVLFYLSEHFTQNFHKLTFT
jgi:hypothetical protein